MYVVHIYIHTYPKTSIYLVSPFLLILLPSGIHPQFAIPKINPCCSVWDTTRPVFLFALLLCTLDYAFSPPTPCHTLLRPQGDQATGEPRRLVCSKDQSSLTPLLPCSACHRFSTVKNIITSSLSLTMANQRLLSLFLLPQLPQLPYLCHCFTFYVLAPPLNPYCPFQPSLASSISYSILRLC